MQKFKVMVATEEEHAKRDLDPKYNPIGTEHTKFEAVNESVARANHRRDMIDGVYPRKSWVEIDETDSGVLAAR